MLISAFIKAYLVKIKSFYLKLIETEINEL